MVTAAMVGSLLCFAGCGRKPEKPKPPVRNPAAITNAASKAHAAKTSSSNLPEIRTPVFDPDIKTGKKFGKVDDEQKAVLKDIKAKLAATRDPDEISSLLDELEREDVRSAELVGIAREALQSSSEDVRESAFRLLADFDSPDALALVLNAMRDESEAVRAAAVETLRFVDDPKVEGILKRALDDESADVHTAVFEVLQTQPDDTKYPVLEYAMGLADPNIGFDAVAMLTDCSTHKAVEILIKALDSKNEDTVINASSALTFLVGQDFDTAAEAKAWWQTNKKRFDAELQEKETSSLTPIL